MSANGFKTGNRGHGESNGRRKGFGERLGYAATKAVLAVVGSLPMSVSHVIAGIVSYLAENVVRYRRKVVTGNLRSCFPEKSDAEIRCLTSGFYRFLGDYFVETARMGRMSREEMMSRMRFENIGELDGDLASGKSATLYLGHYCNWEWVSSIPLHLKSRCRAGEIYHPLENAGVDDAFLENRSRWGADCVAMADTLRWLTACRREGIPTVTGYIADQAPLYRDVHCFVDFLNHDIPVFTGPERLARLHKGPVYYIDMRCEGRGRYVGRFVKMTDDASRLEPFELTRRYFRMLEESIRHAPQYWLWSHKRFKRTRKRFIEVYGEEDAARRLSHL